MEPPPEEEGNCRDMSLAPGATFLLGVSVNLEKQLRYKERTRVFNSLLGFEKQKLEFRSSNEINTYKLCVGTCGRGSLGLGILWKDLEDSAYSVLMDKVYYSKRIQSKRKLAKRKDVWSEGHRKPGEILRNPLLSFCSVR